MVEEGGEHTNQDERQRGNRGEDQGRDVTAEERGLRESVGSARQALARSFDRVTGAEFRRQFEEFTNVVTTTVLGIHRDQSELRDGLDKVEGTIQAEPSTPPTQKLVFGTFIFSLIALILGVVALVRTL